MPADELRDAVAARAGRPVPAWASRLRVRLDAGNACWTVSAEGGRVAATAGGRGHVDAVLEAPAEVLAAVVLGEVDGVVEGVEGRLTSRGSLPATLQLPALLGYRPGDRPPGFAEPLRVTAAGIDTFAVAAGEAVAGGPVTPDAAANGRPPVVLLHGMGATNSSMFPTLIALRGDRRVIAVDLPGHGGSARPRGAAYDPEFFAGWLVALLDGLGLHRVDLVGNSLGGRIALELGFRAPERVAAMALYGPSVAFIRRRGPVRLVRRVPDRVAAVPLRLPVSASAAQIRRMMADPSRLPADQLRVAAEQHARMVAEPSGRIALLATARQIYLEDARGPLGFWDRLADLAVPALFIWGKQDTFVSPRFARHVQAALPDAPVVLLDDCGHIPQFEQPERTHALTREFLDNPAATTAFLRGEAVTASG